MKYDNNLDSGCIRTIVDAYVLGHYIDNASFFVKDVRMVVEEETSFALLLQIYPREPALGHVAHHPSQ